MKPLVAGLAGASAEVGAVAAGWRAWLAHEKRQAPASVKAYQTDLAGFLGFCAEHRGGAPCLDELAGLAAADFRAWLAWRHRQGLARTSTASTGVTTPRSRRCARRACPSACRARCRARRRRR